MKVSLPYTLTGRMGTDFFSVDLPHDGKPMMVGDELLPPGLYTVLGKSGEGKTVFVEALARANRDVNPARLTLFEPEDDPLVELQLLRLLSLKKAGFARGEPWSFVRDHHPELQIEEVDGGEYPIGLPSSMFGDESDDYRLVDLANVGFSEANWPDWTLDRLRALAVVLILAGLREAEGPVFVDSLRVPMAATSGAAGERGTDPLYISMLSMWSPLLAAAQRTVVTVLNPNTKDERFFENLRSATEGTTTGTFIIQDGRVDLTYRLPRGQGRRNLNWDLEEIKAGSNHPTPNSVIRRKVTL